MESLKTSAWRKISPQKFGPVFGQHQMAKTILAPIDRSRPGNDAPPKENNRSSTMSKAKIASEGTRASLGSGKNFSGGPDHKTPSLWGTGGGSTIRASYAFGPSAFSP
jgi:hypothetical protein